MEDSPFIWLAFLSVFHVIGGIALGSAIRGVQQFIRGEGGSLPNSLFFAVWGGMFGCMPLAFGFDPAIPNWVLVAQVVILLVVIVVTVIFGRAALGWLKPVFNIHTGLMIFGGIFMAAGLGGAYATLKEGDLSTALILGLVFGIIGLGIFVLGLAGLFKNALAK